MNDGAYAMKSRNKKDGKSVRSEREASAWVEEWGSGLGSTSLVSVLIEVGR